MKPKKITIAVPTQNPVDFIISTYIYALNVYKKKKKNIVTYFQYFL